jgi:putative SOS response-associated peptidase YedK
MASDPEMSGHGPLRGGIPVSPTLASDVCGRFVTASSPALLAERLAVDETDESVEPDPEPDYNVSPRRAVLAVREHDGRRVMSRLRWGLVPSWAKNPSVGDRMINARAETLAARPAYRSAFADKRCIIPADGFYEWKPVPSLDGARPRKQPYFIHRRDGEPLAFAGLWEVWKIPEGTEDLVTRDGWLRSCVIVTTTANALLEPIHNRMPVILPETAWAQWLDPDQHDTTALAEFLVPADAQLLEAYEVSTRVNDARNSGSDLARRLGLDA